MKASKQSKTKPPPLAEQVMAARKERRKPLTQAQVQELTGVDQARVSKIERGIRPTTRELLLLSKGLRVRFIVDARSG